jgi:hypothetical protein
VEAAIDLIGFSCATFSPSAAVIRRSYVFAAASTSFFYSVRDIFLLTAQDAAATLSA